MRSSSLRAGLVVLAIAGTVGIQVPQGSAAAPAAHTNRIVVENRKPGSTRWQLPWPGYTVADDINLQIKGFATTPSTAPSGHVPLKVTVTPAQSFTVDVFRLGWYSGEGGRHMAHLGPFAGIEQPACQSNPKTLMLSCADWHRSLVVNVPTDWLSGVYVAVFSSDAKFQSLAPFWVVDDSRASDLLYVSSVNTYQAYNNFPYDPPKRHPEGYPRTGHSLYDYNSAQLQPAVKVSFDRP